MKYWRTIAYGIDLARKRVNMILEKRYSSNFKAQIKNKNSHENFSNRNSSCTSSIFPFHSQLKMMRKKMRDKRLQSRMRRFRKLKFIFFYVVFLSHKTYFKKEIKNFQILTLCYKCEHDYTLIGPLHLVYKT